MSWSTVSILPDEDQVMIDVGDVIRFTGRAQGVRVYITGGLVTINVTDAVFLVTDVRRSAMIQDITLLCQDGKSVEFLADTNGWERTYPYMTSRLETI